jgi:transcriptional regulator with XRE-family HTH domain
MPRQSPDVPEEYTQFEHALAKAIGARIRRRRRQLKLTQENVRVKMEVESVHVSRARFSRIEIGDTLPNAAEVFALTLALEVSYSWLITGKEEETRG